MTVSIKIVSVALYALRMHNKIVRVRAWKMRPQIIPGFLAATFLSACASAFSDNTTTAGASVFQFDYESVDLVMVLDPDGEAAKKAGAGWAGFDEGQKIDLAFEAFHKNLSKLEEDTAKAERRNRVQNRLMGASEQLCHQYQQYMQNLHSSGNFTLGFLTTATAAAGALVTGGASQVLAGAAAALSGTRAEFNQDYFYEEAVPVIMKGIKAKRTELAATIKTNREAATAYADYTVEQAITDAIEYHRHCSLVAGVQQLSKLASIAEDAGLKRLQEIDQQVRQREALYKQEEDPTGALVQLKQDVADALTKHNARIAGLANLASSDGAVEALKNAADAAGQRVNVSNNQLDACQARAFELAGKIRAERDAAEAASTDSARTAAFSRLQDSIDAGSSFIRTIEPIKSTLILDLANLDKAFSEVDSAAGNGTVDPEPLGNAVTALMNKTTEQESVAYCLPPS